MTIVPISFACTSVPQWLRENHCLGSVYKPLATSESEDELATKVTKSAKGRTKVNSRYRREAFRFTGMRSSLLTGARETG